MINKFGDDVSSLVADLYIPADVEDDFTADNIGVGLDGAFFDESVRLLERLRLQQAVTYMPFNVMVYLQFDFIQRRNVNCLRLWPVEQ